ncbi:SPX domain-containing protein 3 [Porphyridium purpureum]|uniref:SPX domain-containing protein 3 n=1 Tax=Porphyridium purpureum TaxID=35688 RepID=A0A5J4YT77_PORPP|nr:SPX domain-containing protein 3 [Porphyridium purpureum]|eukprot:POR5094..scf227_4
MKFGKKLRRLQKEAARHDGDEWAFISYKRLKKILHQMAAREFAPSLRVELRKVNMFFLDKQHELALACARAELELQYALNKARKVSSMDVNALKGSLIALHAQFVQLELFSTMNFAGFRKILKKYDKKHGTKLKKRCLRQFKLAPFFGITYVNMLAKGVLELISQLERFGKFRRIESANLGGAIAARHSAHTSRHADVIAAWPSTHRAPSSRGSLTESEAGILRVRVGQRRTREQMESEDAENVMPPASSSGRHMPDTDQDLDRARLTKMLKVLVSLPSLRALVSAATAASSMELASYTCSRLVDLVDSVEFAAFSSRACLMQDLSRVSLQARVVSGVLEKKEQTEAIAPIWGLNHDTTHISIHFVYLPAGMQLDMILRDGQERGYIVQLVCGTCRMTQYRQEGCLVRGELALHEQRMCAHAHGVWPAWSLVGLARHHKIEPLTNCLLLYVTLGGLVLKPAVTFENTGVATDTGATLHARRGAVQRLIPLDDL